MLICEYCKKEGGLTKLVDNKHVLHIQCEEQFKNRLVGSIMINDMKERSRKTIDAWTAAGLFSGITGHVNHDIANLYECCKSSKID